MDKEKLIEQIQKEIKKASLLESMNNDLSEETLKDFGWDSNNFYNASLDCEFYNGCIYAFNKVLKIIEKLK